VARANAPPKAVADLVSDGLDVMVHIRVQAWSAGQWPQPLAEAGR